MRLRRNEYCPIHKSISCCGREQTPYDAQIMQPGVRASKIRIIRGDIGNSDPQQKCGSF